MRARGLGLSGSDGQIASLSSLAARNAIFGLASIWIASPVAAAHAPVSSMGGPSPASRFTRHAAPALRGNGGKDLATAQGARPAAHLARDLVPTGASPM